MKYLLIIYKSKDELLKDINNIFNENDNHNYILISFLYDELLKLLLKSSNDEQDNLVKDNNSSLSQLIHFYPFLLKMIYYVKNKMV